MLLKQIMVFAILLLTLTLFLNGRWRHDIVALFSLLISVIVGLVPTELAFSGFSHPAVITVAAVLVLSGALQHTGVVDVLAQKVLPSNTGPTLSIAALATLGAVLSSFMNNVGALALLMPIAIQTAQKQGLPPGRVLMPLSIGTMLGGMTTLIGTPSNLVVSSFRKTESNQGFAMFDFTAVGLTVAAVGILFISIIGWRIIPRRDRAGAETFNTAAYLTEAKVAPDSKAIGKTLREAEAALGDVEAQIISLIRNNIKIINPHPSSKLFEGDILLIEADPEILANAMQSLGLIFAEDKSADEKNKKNNDKNIEKEKKDKTEKKAERANLIEDSDLVELVILPGSNLAGRTARGANLRTRFSINVLAVSRQGARIQSRVRSTPLRFGDVLLVQGSPDFVNEFASSSGCAPLATRSMRTPDRKKMTLSLAIMLLSIALAALNILPAAISFAIGVLLVMVTKVLPLRRVYHSIDWPVIVLLGALLPVAQTMETTGAANLIAHGLLDFIANGNVMWTMALIMVLTMLLTDMINNAATAAIMSPIAISSAQFLEINADPFLIAVAIGSSCAFMTPIGHQNNTLIMGPGGFRFSDYWPLGLPLELLVLATSIPAIMYFWF